MTHMASKKDRQTRILEIIRERNIKTQDELADALCREGWDVTQATVSRDIKELELVKVRAGGESIYAAPSANENEILRSSVISIDHAMNIVVVKTLSGMAQGVASLMDNMHIGDTLGTIAGDDTIMIVARDERAADTIHETVDKMRG